MRKIGLLLALAAACLAADNTLTPEEAKSGWTLLFDGKTMQHWRDPAKENQPGDGWTIEDGCLKTRPHPRITEDLVSQEFFGDFEVKFDWRVSPGANTGFKYRLRREVFLDLSKLQRGPGGFEGIVGREMAHPVSNRATLAPDAKGQVYTVAFECQLIDDQRHPDAKRDATHVTGALYSMLAPTARAAHPAGEWNTALIVLHGNHFEHWLNGVKVLEGRLDDPRVREGVEKRWGPAPQVREALLHPAGPGQITLQHHGDEVWFRNVKIRRRGAVNVGGGVSGDGGRGGRRP